MRGKRNAHEIWQNNHPKVRAFMRQYPHKLICVEFDVKFVLEINKKMVTYNPDFYCHTTKHFIEVVTSKSNISEQSQKWRLMLKKKYPLKIIWWEGHDITNFFYKFNIPSKILDKVYIETVISKEMGMRK